MHNSSILEILSLSLSLRHFFNRRQKTDRIEQNRAVGPIKFAKLKTCLAAAVGAALLFSQF
jgi:hypothetical protein